MRNHRVVLTTHPSLPVYPISEVGDIIRSPRRHARAAMMELLIRVLGGLEVNCQLVLCPCLRWQIGRFLAFEDVSHRGVVAGQDFDDHRIDGYHSS